MENAEKIAELIANLQGADDPTESGATSPGPGPGPKAGAGMEQGKDTTTSRPRTFPYMRYLPYEVESPDQRQDNLDQIIRNLYVAVQAGDFAVDALYWTRELRAWLGLKFDLAKSDRIKLVKLYYELSLAPGIDHSAADKFAAAFRELLKRKHYLRPIEELTLDWRPMFRELKDFVMPGGAGALSQHNVRRNYKSLTRLCAIAQTYFDPKEIPAFLEEVLPYFTASFIECAFVVVGLINLLFPTNSPPQGREDLLPQAYLPTFFHIWSLLNRSQTIDINFLDILSRLSRDGLTASHVPFTDHGIHTKEQSEFVFTAILRLLHIPVGQATSPYSQTVDSTAGLAVYLDRDVKKYPPAHHIARWIIMSLSPASLESSDSVLGKLEGLIQAVETFFHPSNSGVWTRTLSQLVYYLADFFVMRWNREKSGEMNVPPERRLNDELKRRFVSCLKDVVFMGIYAKSGTAMDYSLSSLRSLAYLEPSLILPGALQRIYPSMQGLVEVHRTTSSLRSLQALSKIMASTKGYRCHITTMLGLALPGIDANDLEKTLYTLSFIQSVCFNVPFQDLTQGTEVSGNMVALDWITGQVAQMEEEGADIELDYESSLTDEQEEMILRSSTAGFGEFVGAFLGKVFTLLENLPDAARARTGSAEENVINTLPSTLLPLLASLSPDLYDAALNKIADFVANHVIHQAKDAMAFICSALCKVNPEKALKKMIPILVASIRTEIDENGAASTRNMGSDVLPRDRGLVWSISMLSMCVVHVGNAMLAYKKDLFDISLYMQQKCKGTASHHVSNFTHHLLLNLTGTYTTDSCLYEPEVMERGLGPQDWGSTPDPHGLNIKWHVPTREGIQFCVDLVKAQGSVALDQLKALMSEEPSVKRDGVGKEWSDEISRNLMLLRLLLSGVCVLFDHKAAANEESDESETSTDIEMVDAPSDSPDPTEAIEDDEQETLNDDLRRPTFTYPAGFSLDEGDALYKELHAFRDAAGETLHNVHRFLVEKQEDDVNCFGPLYTAYRSWFTDVGIERTAHVLDRVQRLLAADIHPYKISGQRKQYPRPLLARRAALYHLQRLRHNAYPRSMTKIAKKLLLDLAESSVSVYTDVRRHAQSAAEATYRAVLGSRTLIIHPLVAAFEKGVKEDDFDRIKGAMFSLFFGTLIRTIAKEWKHAPKIIRVYLAACATDKPSIHKLCSAATLAIMDISKPLERLAVVDDDILSLIAPTDDVQSLVDAKRFKLKRKRGRIDSKKAALSEELIDLARKSHWKQASRTGGIVVSLGLRFEHIATENMIDLITRGAIEEHPSLRALYAGAFNAIMALVDARAIAGHTYKGFLTEERHLLAEYKVETKPGEPQWTQKYLDGFAGPEAEYFIDNDHPGWLVWEKKMEVHKTNPEIELHYDEIESTARARIGKILDKHWFTKAFEYMKQEPRDSASDRFRMSHAMMLGLTFELMHGGQTTATFQDIKEETTAVFGDGTDKHQHRATAEILGALLISSYDKPETLRQEVWDFAYPIFKNVFSDGLNPENMSYWTMFVHLIIQSRDPRRNWELVEWLSSFRLDMDSNAAFKESAKIRLLQQCVADLGWHFRLSQPIIDDFLSHLDHAYKALRESMGQTLSTLYGASFHESYKDVPALLAAQKEASSLGTRPYAPTPDFTTAINDIFARIEAWRHERAPGQQTPSSYTSGSKTVMLWLDNTLGSEQCTQLVPFFPKPLLEALLHMMDIKEDPELQGLAYHVFRHIPNIPHRSGEDSALIEELVRVGRSSPLWHQRLRVLINMQVIYFRRLFMLDGKYQKYLFDSVAGMLEDPQLEVRLGASSTLSGMIRCSPTRMRVKMVEQLHKQFTDLLLKHPLPKKPRGGLSATAAASAPGTGTSTPTAEHTKLVVTRHAAVLGLGALVQAFPYQSPPPKWIPVVLATLANKANNDPGMVGKSVKSILSDFKKTRQDTWLTDLKAFTQEQAEDLDGVLWKGYFA